MVEDFLLLFIIHRDGELILTFNKHNITKITIVTQLHMKLKTSVLLYTIKNYCNENF